MAIDHEGFVRSMNGESPRARIMLQAGMLEELLRTGIRRRLPNNKSSEELFGGGSSLGLGALAKYAHAFGIIGARELHDTKQFANIRNELAHHWDSSFSKKEVQNKAEKIRLIQLKSATTLASHQVAFSKTDYFGMYFVETLANRLIVMASNSQLPAEFLKSIEVDIDGLSKIIKLEKDV